MTVPVPKVSRPLRAAFLAVFDPFRRRRLHLRLAPPAGLDPALPVLWVADHVSWWDGFLALELHRASRPGGDFLAAMLERELVARPLFRHLGCLGLEPGSPASLRSLLVRLRARRGRDGNFSLAFFPQGRIGPASLRPLGFRPGVEAVVAALAPVQVVPVALRIEPLARCAPHAFALAGRAELVVRRPPRGYAAVLEARVQELLDRLEAHLARLGEDAADAPLPEVGP